MLNYTVFSIKLFLLLLVFCQAIIPVSFVSYADELLLIGSFALILILGIKDFRIKGSTNYTVLLLLSLIGYSIINYLISPFSGSFVIMFIQSLVSVKAIVVLFGFTLIYENTTLFKQTIRSFFIIFIILFILSLLLNLIIGETWNTVLGAQIKYRDGLLRPVGIMSNPGNLGDYFVITITTLFFISYSNFIKSKPIISYILFSSFTIVFSIMIFTVRKPLLMLIPLFFILKGYMGKRLFYTITFSGFALLLGITLLTNGNIFKTTSNNLKNFTTLEDNSYIRGIMFYNSINFFVEEFPFGTSPGTFGSNLSQLNSTKAYEEAGITRLSWVFNDEGRMEGVFDTGIGSILAEFGFIGLIIYIFFIITFYKYFRNKYSSVAKVFSILLVYILLNTIVNPGIMHGYTSTFLIINSLYLITYNDEYSVNI